jgi:hypothetical protein
MGNMIPILVLMTVAIAGAAPLLPNGGFEEANATNAAQPAGWDRLDGLGVRWETETNGPANRFIRMDTAVSEKAYVSNCQAAGLSKWVFPNPANDPIAATYGLSYYSDWIPVATGRAYRLSFRYRGASGGGKVWVRGYGMIQNEERRRYDTVVNCRTQTGGWNAFSQCFHPTQHTPTVTRIRIMLYAYWPPGVYAFDDVAVTPVSEAEWLADHRENE